MAVLRKFLHLEEYLHPVHFENLGKLLLMMSLLWGYFVFAERLTTWYGNEPAEMAVFWVTQTRIVRAALLDDGGLQLRDSLSDPGDQEAADDHRLRDRVVGVVVGMWLERFLIVVPSLGTSTCRTPGASTGRGRSRS